MATKFQVSVITTLTSLFLMLVVGATALWSALSRTPDAVQGWLLAGTIALGIITIWSTCITYERASDSNAPASPPTTTTTGTDDPREE